MLDQRKGRVREIHFFGELRKRFGAVHRMAGDSLPEILLSIDGMHDGALRSFALEAESAKVGLAVWVDGVPVDPGHALSRLPDDAKVIEVMPYPLAAAQYIVYIIIAAILITVAIRSAVTDAGTDGEGGFAFSSPSRSARQGDPKPIVWGRTWAEGSAISSGTSGVEPSKKNASFFRDQERRVIDLVSEGEIEGWAKQDVRSCIAIDETTILQQDAAASRPGFWELETNEENEAVPNWVRKFDRDRPYEEALDVGELSWSLRRGNEGQDPIDFAPSPELEVPVGVDMLRDDPVTRSTSPAADLRAIRVNLAVRALIRVGSDSHTQKLGFTIDVEDTASSWRTRLQKQWDLKIDNQRTLSFEVDVEGDGPWNITLTKFTKDTEGSARRDVQWTSFVEVTNAQLNYSGSAVVGVRFRASDYRGTPDRKYLLKGMKVRVPTGYDPVARTMATAAWDGTFQAERQWTDNQIWQVCEYMTNPALGLGTHLRDGDINWGSAYRAARRCDQSVNDQAGGTEFRHSFGLHDVSSEEGWRKIVDMCESAMVVPYWDGQQISFMQDRPSSIRDEITPERVVDGRFEYSGSPLALASNRVVGKWSDEDQLDRPSVEVVESPARIRKFGLIHRDINVRGIRKKAEMNRFLNNVLLSEQYEGESLSFSMLLPANFYMPGDVLNVTDPDRGGEVWAGLLAHATATTADLDKPVTLESGKTYKLRSPQPAYRQILTASGASGTTITLDYAPLLGIDAADAEGSGFDPSDIYTEYISVRQDVDADGVYEKQRMVTQFDDATLEITLGEDGLVGSDFPTVVEYRLPVHESVVTNTAGETKKLTLATPFTLAPMRYGAWTLKEQNESPEQWRVRSIREDGDTSVREVRCDRYYHPKYAMIDSLPDFPIIDREHDPIPAIGTLVPPPGGATAFVESRQVRGQTRVVVGVRWNEPSTADPNYHSVIGYQVMASRDGQPPFEVESLTQGREAFIEIPALGHWHFWVRSVDVERRVSSPAWDGVLYDEFSTPLSVGEIVGLRIRNSKKPYVSESETFHLEWNYRQPGAEEDGDTVESVDGVSSFIVEAWDMRGGGLLHFAERTPIENFFDYTPEMNRLDQYRINRSSPARDIRFVVWARGSTGEDGKKAELLASNSSRPAPAWAFTATQGSSTKASLGQIHAEIINSGESTLPPDAAGFALWGSTVAGFTPSPDNLLAVAQRGSRFVSAPVDSDVTWYGRIAQLDTLDGPADEITDPESQLNLSVELNVSVQDGAVFPVQTEDIAADAVTEFGIVTVPLAGPPQGSAGQSWTANSDGGKTVVSISASLEMDGSTNDYSMQTWVNREYVPSAVIYYNGSSYVDETADAVSASGPDVLVPMVQETGDENTDEALYIGLPIKFGALSSWWDPTGAAYTDSNRVVPGTSIPSAINMDVTAGLSNSLIEYRYWTSGGMWQTFTFALDTTSGFENDGYVYFTTVPSDWAPRTVNGVGPYYFIRAKQKNVATGTNLVLNSISFKETLIRRYFFFDRSVVGDRWAQRKFSLSGSYTIDWSLPTESFHAYCEEILGLQDTGTPQGEADYFVNIGKDKDTDA